MVQKCLRLIDIVNKIEVNKSTDDAVLLRGDESLKMRVKESRQQVHRSYQG